MMSPSRAITRLMIFCSGFFGDLKQRHKVRNIHIMCIGFANNQKYSGSIYFLDLNTFFKRKMIKNSFLAVKHERYITDGEKNPPFTRIVSANLLK